MSGDGRRLSVRLHELARTLEAFMPWLTQDYHEIADEVAALEVEKPLAKGYMMKIDDWCDGKSGYRHHPVYWYVASAEALAKKLGCDYQAVIILPAKKEPTR